MKKVRSIIKRPKWCPHSDCKTLRTLQDKMCKGKLSKPEAHDGDFNTHRLCFTDMLPGNEVLDVQVNKTDLFWLRTMIDEMIED